MTKRILIIDDDAEFGEELAELLSAEGYPAESVADSAAGLALAGRKEYDVFLLDYKMAELTGLDLLRSIRKKKPAAAVFIISGRSGLAALLEKESLAGEVCGVMEKPFDPGELLKKIRACRSAQPA